MAKVFVITGPSGVGKGTLIGGLLGRVPDLELSISATTRAPREGEVEGRDYHFLTAEEFERRVGAEEFLEFATYSGNRYGTLRSEVERCLQAGSRWCSRSRSRGPSRCAPPMPESVQIFIAPPDPADLRRRLEGRGTDSDEAIDTRLEMAEQELAAQGDFDHRIVNDDLDRAGGRAGGDRARRARLTSRLRRAMIKPRVDKLLDHADSHYAAVVVSAKRARQINSYFHNLGEGSFGEYPPPMVEIRQRAELPLDGARGACRGQAQIRVPRLSAPLRRRDPGGTDGQNPARRQRRDRRLQVAGVRPPGDRSPATACGC